MSEFGRVCERGKLKWNVGQSKVMMWSNEGRMSGLYNYLGSQVAADGGCEMDVVHRMNEGYRALVALKSVLNNRVFGIKGKICLY